MKSKINRTGIVDIAVLNPDGSVKSIIHLKNEIKTVGLNLFRDALKGEATDLQIKYLAWGSSSTANSPSQTKLVAEFGRKAVTSQTDGDDGELITVTYVSPTEANSPKVEELGWFAGPDASETTDSGIMIARVLYSHQKTNLEALQVARTDGFAAA